MKYIFLGDTHGKLELVEALLSDAFKGYHKVFVGDYVDSFDRSSEAQIQIVRLLLNSVTSRGDVTALIGNHELSYLRAGMECSGRRSNTAYSMTHLKTNILRHFKRHLYVTDDILVTHAGATYQNFEDKTFLKMNLEQDSDILYRIGRSRGGWSTAGGIFWCDYWEEFQPIKGLTQIVGHTSYRPFVKKDGKHCIDKGIVLKDGCYNIDCLDRVTEALTYDSETGVFMIIDFMEGGCLTPT